MTELVGIKPKIVKIDQFNFRTFDYPNSMKNSSDWKTSHWNLVWDHLNYRLVSSSEMGVVVENVNIMAGLSNCTNNASKIARIVYNRNNSNVKVYELNAHFIDSFGIIVNEFHSIVHCVVQILVPHTTRWSPQYYGFRLSFEINCCNIFRVNIRVVKLQGYSGQIIYHFIS